MTAADTNIVPLSGEGWGNAVWIDGHDATQREDSNFSSVSPDYFNTLRIPMVAGRDFNDNDTSQSPRVAIVNEAFAKKLGLGANAVGARFWREATPSSPEQLNEIVGVVKRHEIPSASGARPGPSPISRSRRTRREIQHGGAGPIETADGVQRSRRSARLYTT